MTKPVEPSASTPRARHVRMLKDGYWDRTEIVEAPDGSLRVRKSSKGEAPPGPWGVEALRREIQYLSALSPEGNQAFPPLLKHWDEVQTPPAVGYEVPFYADHSDAGAWARQGGQSQSEVDGFQEILAELVFDRVHTPAQTESISRHVASVVEQALAGLETDPELAPLIRASAVHINGEALRGTRAAFELALQSDLPSLLDGEPQVRLHGDLFLENILWQAKPPATVTNHEGAGTVEAAPRLLLIDPVSVAGVDAGPPLFDLVKYESYAKGELPALRSEWLDVSGFSAERAGQRAEQPLAYAARVRWHEPGLEPFRRLNWYTRFRQLFEAKYGRINPRAYRLLDGYFSVAMAMNTSGNQRRARLLKATVDFNAVDAQR